MSQIKFPHIFPVNIDAMDAVRTDEGHIWGYEKWLVNDKDHDVCTKLLIIFPGFLSSKHAHETKWEYFIIMAGELTLHEWKYGPDEESTTKKLECGQRHYIPEGRYHRFETGTREFVLLLEVSGYENEATDKKDKAKALY